MARIPKLDSAGRFLAADVNAQIDARTKATMRADLPALAEELGIGGGDADSMAQVMGGYLVVSGTAPTETERNGLPVIWIDATVTRDPGAWQATAPTFQGTVGTYTIPQDEGALYLVGGTVKASGAHRVTPPVTVTVTAQARAGYTLAGTTSWTYAFEPKPLDLAPLGALITADAPSHYVTLKSGDYADKGSAPLTWTADAGVTQGKWGAKVAGPGAQVVSQTASNIGIAGGLTAFTVEVVAAHTDITTLVAHQDDFQLGTQESKAYDTAGRVMRYTPVPASQVTHYAAVLDAGTLTIYRNGAPVGSSVFTETRHVTYPVKLGLRGAAEIAHVAIYRGKALSAARIAEHAKAVTG